MKPACYGAFGDYDKKSILCHVCEMHIECEKPTDQQDKTVEEGKVE